MADMLENESSNKQQNVVLSPREFDLLERIIRMEQELKDLKESMDKRFSLMQESMDKRFSLMQWTVTVGFTLIGLMMTLYKFIP